MGVIDLDKARKARREAKGEGPKVKFGGKTYELAPEIPFSVLEALRDLTNPDTADEGLVNMTKALLGRHYKAFVKMEPTVEDVSELLGGVMEEYGINAPLPSSVSSTSTSTR